MKKATILATTALSGVVLAASLATPAYAWHPQGTITKYVTNVTDNGKMSDANTAASAVATKPGDVLKYTVVVSNPAQPAANNDNDLAFVKLTDTLPNGVEMANNASQRAINEDLGTIAPGKSVTKEYTVKVTAKVDMIIENKACFNGNSVVKDNPQSGCDTANVKVTVPQTPVTPPVTPPAPVTPAKPAVPTQLPNTGAGDVLVIGGLVAVAGYTANLLRLRYVSRRTQ